jgi:DNA-binding beta-propeller fold protein YncE
MDDQPLRDLLDGALAGEPPIGPVAHNSLAAGLRLRRRRRIRTAATATVAAVVIAVAVPAGLGASGHLARPAEPTQPSAAPTPYTLYIYGYDPTGPHGGTVTPVNTATNTPGKPIQYSPPGTAAGVIAITPDGKTVYATTGPDVTPISTATNTAGTPIHVVVGSVFQVIAITP